MSWSVSAKGNPAKVKEALVGQFERAKQQTAHIAHESATVGRAEEVVNKELGFAIEKNVAAVAVEAGGSAWQSDLANAAGEKGGCQVTVKVETIYGLLL